jgi:Ser/Thr protein kinase RdoA (MazF antagonist)
VGDRLREIGDDWHARLFPPIAEKVNRLLRPLEDRFAPRLLHGDAFPRNALITDERRLVWMDWDEATSGIWPEDLSRLSYWFAYPNTSRGRIAGLTREQVIDFFLRGYGETEFAPAELARVTHALHIVYSADLLSHRHKTNNTESFKRILKVLMKLLAISC